tara:strand:- start:379 stop:900 length:522 start_codon:yes stop_codon:yes gene_type:complete
MASTLKVNTIQHTGGNTGITVASDGKIAMPNSSGFVSDFVAWSVKKTSNQSTANGAQTQVSWDTEIFDTQNAFASNVFTVPTGQDGYYNVGFFINWQGSWSAQVIQYIRVNGAPVATFMEQKTGNEMGEGGSQLIAVNAGQTIDIAVYQASGGNQNIYGTDSLSTRFWGYRVG